METEIEFRTAIRDALDEELARDESVIFFGEDVAVAGGVFAATTGPLREVRAGAVFDTPISELAMTGAAFGAAVTGKRPVLEIMFGDFLALSMDSLINQATKYWFLTGERQSCPARDPLGRRRRRSLRRDPLADAGLVADRDPRSQDRRAVDTGRREEPAQGRDPRRQPGRLLRAQAALLDLRPGGRRRDRAARGRQGRSRGRRRHARQRDEGRPRLPRRSGHARGAGPLGRGDRPAHAQADRSGDRPGLVQKTNRIAVVEEGPLTGGWAGEVLALVTEEGLGDLDDAWRITTPNSPIPYSPPLEDAFLPGRTGSRPRSDPRVILAVRA